MDPTEQLLSSVDDAPWLPPGSAAQAWVGRSCTSFEPAIIVRMLLTRRTPQGLEFFTVPTERGDDLPTLHLGHGTGRIDPETGLATLLEQTVGCTPPTRCVGFIRNVVPHPDDTYPHPTPHAHVPVFAVTTDVAPVVPGRWYSLDQAQPDLAIRHWWPIVAHALNHVGSVVQRQGRAPSGDGGSVDVTVRDEVGAQAQQGYRNGSEAPGCGSAPGRAADGDRVGHELHIRRFEPDDAAALTSMLHEAYAELGALGLNFTAVDQDVAITLARAGTGICWVAERAGVLLGTITMSYPAYGPLRQAWPPAGEPGVAWLNQLAVALQARGTGLASTLFRTGLNWAREQGAHTIGLDTAVPATHLVALYERWGFTSQGTIHWPGKTYHSVVMTRHVSS